MSQVIVTSDELRAKREHTKNQENKIPREGAFGRFRISSPNQMKPFFAVALAVFMPIIFFWGMLLLFATIGLLIFTTILRFFNILLFRRES